MKIVVCIKQVLNSVADVCIDNGEISYDEANLIINPWDEYAIEAALQQKEALGGTVTAISIGPDISRRALMDAIAIGADDAILISDPALKAIDTQSTARVLARVIKKLGGVGMAFFGKQTIDIETGLVPAQTARLLGWPFLSLTAVIKVDGSSVCVERNIEEGRQIVTATLPTVFSIAKDFGDIRNIPYMRIREASRSKIPVWSLADLGILAPAAVIAWPKVLNPSVRNVTCKIITGISPNEVAEELADKILAKVLR